MIKDIEALIIANTQVGINTFKMEIDVETDLCGNIKPGQFLMIKTVNFSDDPLLRRALAIADVEESRITLFYDVVGRGTKLLSLFKAGDKIKILFPLGNGTFPLSYEENVLIGGGIGMAGLTLLGKELLKRGKKVTVVYGAKTKKLLSMESFLRDIFKDVYIFTEDGSAGEKGYATDILNELTGKEVIHACGPMPMLKSLYNRGNRFKIFMSFESPMACGWGVCLGCVIKDKNHNFLRVCKEGPVFEKEQVII